MTTAPDIEAAARAYAAYFEELTPDRLNELERFCAPKIRFRDPFNDVTGVAALQRVFLKMYEDVDEPRFRLDDIAVSGATAYLRWHMTFRKMSKDWEIVGMSEVHFDGEGRAVAHIDHWDAAGQLYERLPIVGALIRILKRRLSAEPPARGG